MVGECIGTLLFHLKRIRCGLPTWPGLAVVQNASLIAPEPQTETLRTILILTFRFFHK